jgi:hypothetical protein
MDILIFSILTNFIYFCIGSIFIPDKKNDFHSKFYIYFIGAILISAISLILNFFTPLTPLINSILYCSIIVTFIIKKKFTLNKKSIIFLLISSFVTFLLIIYSTINRPDAGLYHLPYTSIINENKIIFGLSNFHFRFGHVSILQYLSAINNNYLFSENGISVPLASIVSFFYLYFFYDIWKVIIKKEPSNFSNFFSLFIVIYIVFKIARYSEFGNDAVAHLSFFYLISCLLKSNLKEINLNKILLISVFTFLNKPTLGLVFIAPLIIFFLQSSFKTKKTYYALFSFPALLLYLWLIKNIIVSGCIIYPVKITCIENLPWTNIQQVTNANIESNAWSKGWPDRIDKNMSMEQFSNNFNWISAWRKKHLNHILNILIPYITILFFIALYIKIKFKSIAVKKNKDLNFSFFLSLITSGAGFFSFLFLFPLYRYGYSFIITLISLMFIVVIKSNLKFKENIPIFKFIFLSCLIIIIAKQGIRIFNNHENAPWPNIYTLDSTDKIFSKTKNKIDNEFSYYLADKGDRLCMYSKSPCTTYPVQNIKYSLKKTYTFLNVK